MKTTQNYINHIVFVVDRSGSMTRLANDVVTVFDNQIKYLAQRSVELDQETRASVYLFDDKTDNIFYDKDVMRLPSLKQHYTLGGMTALIDATLKSMDDLEKTPELYGDHAFLIYVLTDGEENASKNRVSTISQRLKNLPENWTVAVMVPDARGIHEAKKFGFTPENIQVWSTTNQGVVEVGKIIRETTDNFMRGRTQGIRGTKSLFKMDTSNLTRTDLKQNLDQLKTTEFDIFPVAKDSVIKDFVEKKTNQSYVKGAAFYQLTKAETIQDYKQVCVQELVTGKVYSGNNARILLGLPQQEVRVHPDKYTQFRIYVQSTSINRKLLKGTNLLVLR